MNNKIEEIRNYIWGNIEDENRSRCKGIKEGEYGKIKSRNCEELEKKLSPLFEGLIRGFRE